MTDTLWSVPDLRAFLRGAWRIDRSLSDRTHALSGTFHGDARFTPEGTSLVYAERGALDFGAHRGTAEQRYRYDFGATNSRAVVRFRDGRFFHTVDLSSGEALVVHVCGPDRYDGRITATGPARWTCAWTIVGPRKQHEVHSLYTRVA